jgi:cell division protein FtsQ
MKRPGARGREQGAGSTGRRIGAALAGVAAAALLAWGAWEGYEATVSLPVKRVVYAGALDRLAQPELDALAQAVLAAPSAPLEAIRASARRVPWVRDASVRRLYPDAVEITFATYTAIARWDGSRLVSPEGDVFAATDARRLPRLRGPEGSAPEMVRELAAVTTALAPVGAVAELRLTPRGAWHAVLESGLAVALGRGDWRPRAARFAAAWPQLSDEARASTYADLRYPGGFALKRAATLTLTPTLSQGRGSKP